MAARSLRSRATRRVRPSRADRSPSSAVQSSSTIGSAVARPSSQRDPSGHRGRQDREAPGQPGRPQPRPRRGEECARTDGRRGRDRGRRPGREATRRAGVPESLLVSKAISSSDGEAVPDRAGPRGRGVGRRRSGRMDRLRVGRQDAPGPAGQGEGQRGQRQRGTQAEAPGEVPRRGRGPAQGERGGAGRGEDQRRLDRDVRPRRPTPGDRASRSMRIGVHDQRPSFRAWSMRMSPRSMVSPGLTVNSLRIAGSPPSKAGVWSTMR